MTVPRGRRRRGRRGERWPSLPEKDIELEEMDLRLHDAERE
jgi:hypothetical protein